MHLIRGKLVHFPGKKGEMVVESTFSTGKCTKKAGKWFTFPGKKSEMAVKSTFSAGKCTKKAGLVDKIHDNSVNNGVIYIRQ